MANVDNPNIRYTQDVTHCDAADCPLYDKCYRGWLNEEIRKLGESRFYMCAAYFMNKSYGKRGCKHFIDINGL